MRKGPSATFPRRWTLRPKCRELLNASSLGGVARDFEFGSSLCPRNLRSSRSAAGGIIGGVAECSEWRLMTRALGVPPEK